MAWPEQPVIYEINTWVWLDDLSRRHGTAVTLGTVPPEEWDGVAVLAVDAVWLMGVWQRSPAGVQVARTLPDLVREYRHALPDYTPDDVVGSPYSVRDYVVDERLGGPEGLAEARAQLARRGVRLLLDYVPNHVALDHPWVTRHPEHLVGGSVEDLARAPDEFVEAAGRVIAFGRDPNYPPWTDTAQLNAFHPGLRLAAVDTLDRIAGQSDGVRCDMAMLLLDDVFAATWGPRAGPRPSIDFWAEVIPVVRDRHPGFLFVAEAYWDLEWELQLLGFDFCYDKRLYDRMVYDVPEQVRLHLTADLAYQRKLLRFIENHDEPRAAALFGPAHERAAAVTMSTLPGARLFHEGQLDGRTVKLPVQLGRRPAESADPGLQAFYRRLLPAVRAAMPPGADWQLCERTGWPDNATYVNLVAWCWRDGATRHLIVVNLSAVPSQARVRVPWADLDGRTWQLTDVLNDEVYDRDGGEMCHPGLFVDLGGWDFHFLRFPA